MRGAGEVRAGHLREAYPHRDGDPLLTTRQVAALAGLTTRTALRRLHSAGIDPVRRGGHGRMLWRRADVTAVVDG